MRLGQFCENFESLGSFGSAGSLESFGSAGSLGSARTFGLAGLLGSAESHGSGGSLGSAGSLGSSGQGSIFAFFETRQPGKYVTKDTCPDKILLAHSKLHNN